MEQIRLIIKEFPIFIFRLYANQCYVSVALCLVGGGSQLLLVLSVGDVAGDDARVAGLELLGVLIEVLIGGDELSLVVAAPVADDDLGGVLIGHDDGGLGKSASEGVGVVGLQGLLEHACVEVVSDLELVLREGGHLGEPLGIEVDGFGRPIIKSKADVLPVFLKDFAARGHLGVLEHRR